MEINISDLTTQSQNSKDDVLLCRERARELENQITKNPLPRGFFFDKEDNVMYQPGSKSDGGVPPAIYICSRLDITAFTRDDNNHMIADAVEQLKAYTNKAVSTLVNLLDVDNNALQRNVANDILNYVARYKEIQELEERIEAMERSK